jgi:hypothetical protein
MQWWSVTFYNNRTKEVHFVAIAFGRGSRGAQNIFEIVREIFKTEKIFEIHDHEF